MGKRKAEKSSNAGSFGALLNQYKSLLPYLAPYRWRYV
jgi:hypothetical protein